MGRLGGGDLGRGGCQWFFKSLMDFGPVIYYNLIIYYLKVSVRTDIILAFVFLN